MIFHACAQTTHVGRLLPYLEVKVRSPTELLCPSFMSIDSGVLLPGVVEVSTFPILRAMAYTTGLGYRPTCDCEFCDQSNYSSRIIFFLYFYPRTKHELDLTIHFRDGHSKLYKTADVRDLGFGPTGSSAIRSVDLENPTLEPNVKWIG